MKARQILVAIAMTIKSEQKLKVVTLKGHNIEEQQFGTQKIFFILDRRVP